MLQLLLLAVITTSSVQCYGYHGHHHNESDDDNKQYLHPSKRLEEMFTWKQLTFDFNKKLYLNDADLQFGSPQKIETPDADKFFIQYNNVPIGLEVYKNKVFVTVPRRRYGIPSTLNYFENNPKVPSPPLKPYPNADATKSFVSVYRPRVDRCQRLWMVDTGLLEVPGERKQIRPPRVVIFDLRTDTELLSYELKSTDLLDERSPAGFTSITVDVNPHDCSDAFAYIPDLATNAIVVFSLRDKDSWRVSHETFVHDPEALNFTVAGNVINWRDGVFSVALSERDESGSRTAFYHPLVSTKEFGVSTGVLKNKPSSKSAVDVQFFETLGERGPLSQSGSHVFHAETKVLLYANVAQDAISCWNTKKSLTPRHVSILVQDHKKLVYISDLKIVGDYVWVLVNQIPVFVYSKLDTSNYNYFIHRGRIQDLIKDTVCDN